MSSVIDSIERRQQRQGLPSFAPGDRVRVHFQVVEGSRRRTQVFEGIVLKRQGSGARETFTVRKQSFGVGVERTFPLHSPKIEKLEIAARGDVRRAKLYYLRGRIGKAARVAERRWGIDEELISTPTPAADAEGVTQAEDDADEGAPTAGPAAGEADEGAPTAGPVAEDSPPAEPEGQSPTPPADGADAVEQPQDEAPEVDAEEPEAAPEVDAEEPEAVAEEPEAAEETPEAEAKADAEAESETDAEPEAAAEESGDSGEKSD